MMDSPCVHEVLYNASKPAVIIKCYQVFLLFFKTWLQGRLFTSLIFILGLALLLHNLEPSSNYDCILQWKVSPGNRPLQWFQARSCWPSEDVETFPVRRGPERENSRASLRRWLTVSVGAGGMSPAQTEPTNAISGSNTIVLFSQANAIILSPVPRALSAHRPPSQTFGPSLRLIFDVDKTHTIAVSPMWSDQGGGAAIDAFLWTGLNNHNSPVCVHIYTCVCVCVCVWKRSLMHSQCSIVPWTATVIYVKILSLRLIHPFSPLLLLLSHFSLSNPAPLVPFSPPSPPLPVLSDCVYLLLFLSLCHSFTLYLRLPASFFPLLTVAAYWSPFLPPTLCCLFVVTLPYHAFTWLFLSALFHIILFFVGLTRELVKKFNKK